MGRYVQGQIIVAMAAALVSAEGESTLQADLTNKTIRLHISKMVLGVNSAVYI